MDPQQLGFSVPGITELQKAVSDLSGTIATILQGVQNLPGQVSTAATSAASAATQTVKTEVDNQVGALATRVSSLEAASALLTNGLTGNSTVAGALSTVASVVSSADTLTQIGQAATQLANNIPIAQVAAAFTTPPTKSLARAVGAVGRLEKMLSSFDPSVFDGLVDTYAKHAWLPPNPNAKSLTQHVQDLGDLVTQVKVLSAARGLPAPSSIDTLVQRLSFINDLPDAIASQIAARFVGLDIVPGVQALTALNKQLAPSAERPSAAALALGAAAPGRNFFIGLAFGAKFALAEIATVVDSLGAIFVFDMTLIPGGALGLNANIGVAAVAEAAGGSAITGTVEGPAKVEISIIGGIAATISALIEFIQVALDLVLWGIGFDMLESLPTPPIPAPSEVRS